MVDAEPALRRHITPRRYHLEGPKDSVYRVLSADAELQQGLNPSFVVFDEVHVQPNRDLWDAMVLGMGTRSHPLIIGITTAGFDRDSLAWSLYDHGKRLEAGELADAEFYFQWSEPSDYAADWRDPAVWKEANPALGDLLLPEALEDDATKTPESAFRRFHLNQWTTTREAWLPHGAWEDCRSGGVEAGAEVVVGLDGSWTGDSTALVGCSIADRHLFVLGAWEKPPDVTDWTVPFEEVEEKLHEALGTYRVREIAADPFLWRPQLIRWAEGGLPVHEWPTNSLARIVPACREFYEAVMTKGLSHDGDARLARHVANAVVKTDRYGMRIVKDTTARKIDLAVAAVIAHDRARYWTAAPQAAAVRFVPIEERTLQTPQQREAEHQEWARERVAHEDEEVADLIGQFFDE